MSHPAPPGDDVAARIARAARKEHDPRELWPGIDVGRLRRAQEGIITAVCEVLAGGTAVPLAAPNDDPVTLGRAAYRLGVGPLLGWWIERAALVPGAGVASALAPHLDHARRRHERLLRETLRIVDALRTAGVEPVLLKGLHVATWYPAPECRAFQDTDLLVATRDMPRVAAVLAGAGFVPGPLRAGNRVDWSAPGGALPSLELTHADGPWGVDVHDGLTRVFHRALLASLPAPGPDDCPTLELPGGALRVLPPGHAIAFLAIHASNNLRVLQLTHLLDLVFAARACGAGAWDDAMALMRAAGSARFAWPACHLAERLAPGCVPAPARATLEAAAHPRLRRAVARLPLTGLAPPDRWVAGYVLMWAATPAEVLRVIWRQLVPGPPLTPEERAEFYRRQLRKLFRGDVRLTGPPP